MAQEPTPLGAALECTDGGTVPAIAIPNECDDCQGLDCATPPPQAPVTWSAESVAKGCSGRGCSSGSGSVGVFESANGSIFEQPGDGTGEPACNCCPQDPSAAPDAVTAAATIEAHGWSGPTVFEGGAPGGPSGVGAPGSSCPEPECCEDSGDGDGTGGDGDTIDCRSQREVGLPPHCRQSQDRNGRAGRGGGGRCAPWMHPSMCRREGRGGGGAGRGNSILDADDGNGSNSGRARGSLGALF